MQRVDALLRQATQDDTIPGAVISVAYRGQVVLHQAYGAAALQPVWRPMQRHSIFDLASLTKVVATTSLLLVAHHEGMCRLDDRVHYFYPETTNSALGHVTVRQLLAHTGGVAALWPLHRQLLPLSLQRLDVATRRRRQRQAANVILRLPLAYAPGSQMVYSDLGFILLADLLEAQYQQSLDTLFLDKVAGPLGLANTGFRPLEGASPLPQESTAYVATEACPWRQRVMVGEVHDENAWAMGGIAGHAGLFATVSDLWRFIHALLETACGKRDWLPATLLQASWQRHPEPSGSTRALGWDTPRPQRSSAGRYFSPRSIGHLGFTGTSIWIDLDHQVTVILCTNRVHPARRATGINTLRPNVHNLVMQALGVAPS